MYKKIHKHLTFLFAGIASLILAGMSVIYLYMSEQALQSNSFLAFSGEMGTLMSNFEQQTTITQEWLSKVSANGKYQIAVYDNDIPLSYTSTALSKDTLSLMAEAAAQHTDTLSDIPSESLSASSHNEFSYTSKDGGHYYVCFVKIQHTPGNLTAIILYSTAQLSRQFMTTRIRFVAINLIGIFLLSVFSWYYTKRLLLPIQKSQEQQMAFIAAASHELRTPLAVILSSLSAIRCTQKTSDFPTNEQKHFLHTIETESGRMSRLVTDLLTLARSDSHSWSFHMKEVELDTILLNAYEAFQPLAAEKKISLDIALTEEHIPPCVCDAERISQVLDILLSNAVSYGTEGGCIKLTLSYQNGNFSLQVIDDGIGIPDEEKSHVFDRFYRVDSARSKKEHFGLGLCIAKEIVTAHHGSIEIHDTPGGGATFTVRLRSKRI